MKLCGHEIDTPVRTAAYTPVREEGYTRGPKEAPISGLAVVDRRGRAVDFTPALVVVFILGQEGAPIPVQAEVSMLALGADSTQAPEAACTLAPGEASTVGHKHTSPIGPRWPILSPTSRKPVKDVYCKR